MLEFFISPSILSADFSRLGEEVQAVVKAGADLIHFDVMDNHYVPNLSFGPMVCRSLLNYGIEAPIDVHLMVKPVDGLIKGFLEAGAQYISFHPEAALHIDRSLALIRAGGAKAGLALNPATPLTILEHVADKLDMVVVMSVNPGFGGQKFIPAMFDKIRAVRAWIDKIGRNIRLQVDGGVGIQNIAQVASAGADTFVAGSAIFKQENYATTIRQMRAQLQAVSKH